MSEPTPPSHLSITMDTGKHPCESDQGAAFLQDRLRLFFKIVFLLCFGFYIFANALAALGPEHDWTCCAILPANWFHLGACALLAAGWWCCSKKCLCRKSLRAIDAGGTILLCCVFTPVFMVEGIIETNPYGLLLAVVNTLMARAIVVPSSALRTMWISAAASLPCAVAGSFLMVDGLQRFSPDVPPTTPVAVYIAWYVVAIIVETVASRVIYGLQREVEQAKKLGQYTLEEKLGEGGMGEVYRASHAMLRRPTAVKLLRPEKAGDRNLARFEREVQLTSNLTHPNTIAIYDYGRTPEGVFYYAMEYLAGLTLEELVKKHGPQPAGRAIHILRQVCASLTEAHRVGLIHRDIKPANIILCERGGVHDVTKVVDFGLVKDVEHKEEVSVSAVNTITGTPLYLSPEAITSPEKIGPRSDLYAVGAVGYYLVTGKHVFESQNFLEITSHHLHTRPETPSSRLGRPLPEDLEGLIVMCLEKDPAKRPKDAGALGQALDACRDAGKWTEEDALMWWEDHAEAVKEAGGDGQAKIRPVPTATAMEVTKDLSLLARRSGRASNGE